MVFNVLLFISGSVIVYSIQLQSNNICFYLLYRLSELALELFYKVFYRLDVKL